MQEKLKQWNQILTGKSIDDIFEFLNAEFEGDWCIASSLGMEDQLLTHYAAEISPMPRIFMLDTLRLHTETYALKEASEAQYQFQYDVYKPDQEAVDAYVKNKGLNAFYDSVENRKDCCGVRKVEPLKRALKGAKAWVTGLRQEQSVTRTTLQLFEWDEAFGLIKVNPLNQYSFEQVKQAVETFDIPINALHRRGYPSIGCEPCTRAIKVGEDIRAGRWWWENADSKECGLHLKKI